MIRHHVLELVSFQGPPGAGKSLICRKAATDFSGTGPIRIIHISAGALIRLYCSNAAPGDALAASFQAIMAKGEVRDVGNATSQLIYDEIRIQSLRYAREASAVGPHGSLRLVILLDGFPRTVQQLVDFETCFKSHIKKFVMISADTAVRAARTERRRLCEQQRAEDPSLQHRDLHDESVNIMVMAERRSPGCSIEIVNNDNCENDAEDTILAYVDRVREFLALA